MIQPDEIKKQAMRWYPDVLAAAVAGSPFFPRDIRFGKVKASETLSGYSRVREGISELISGSRERLGYGYSIEFVVRKDRKTGEQRFPERIWFADEHDYLRFIGKKREYDEFKSDSALILDAIPALRAWLLANPLAVVEHAGAWRDLLAVCGFFLANPRPNLYIRELPLELPTKFVEEHKAVLRQLLDQLIPESINKAVSNFEQRYNLKYDEPLIRMRILDSDVVVRRFNGLRDLSIPQSEFNSLDPECRTVLILENKTNFSNIYNFLALPGLERTIALFGKGFQLSLLKEAAWLRDKQIIYWGDIDVHGFQILSQLRSYFPQTRSLMMDRETFQACGKYCVTGPETVVTLLPNLTPEEADLFNHLLTLREKNRLEQEKISHAYAVEKIRRVLALGRVHAQ